jgi:UDP-N-acetylmuramoyl-tripeptide--D-alanyl-D-alanine ligase
MALSKSGSDLHRATHRRFPGAARLRPLLRLLKRPRQWWKRRRKAWRHWGAPWIAVVKRATMRRVTFVAVTGSCGKTTTAYLVGAVLGTAGPCRVGIGNNSREALAKNILAADARTRFLVHEISGSRPGRVTTQVRLLRPTIGILTTIGTDHYKAFRSLEATAEEKGKLVETLPPTGVAILNADDPHVRAMTARTTARVITYGLSPDADVRATQVTSIWPDRLSLTVMHGRASAHIQTQLVGSHWATSVLAAVACGIACGVDLATCAAAIANSAPIFGRYSVHAKPHGARYVFDHKAPVWTVSLSFSFIDEARAPRKTMVFGTISDYPGAASPRYRRIAAQALEVADRVVFVGPQSSHVRRLQEGKARDRLFAFQTAYQASMFLAKDIEPGELIFIKGSLGVDHLERIMLSQVDHVVCWRERCKKEKVCPECSRYRQAAPPSFGVVEQGTASRNSQESHY